MQQYAGQSKWAAAGDAAEDTHHAVMYKVEIFTGDVRGAGTHVSAPRMHASQFQEHMTHVYNFREAQTGMHFLARERQHADVVRFKISHMLQAPAAIQLIGTDGESDEFILGKYSSGLLKA
jgi:hypothetical protein